MNAARKYDILPFYQDDKILNQDDMPVLKSICDLNLSELMGEDHNVWIQKNSKFGFNIEIDNKDTHTIIKENGLHPNAIECFASFCREFLASYERFSKE